MKKIFTLAAAAVMAFSASAVSVVSTQTKLPALCPAATEAAEQIRAQKATVTEFISRAGEDATSFSLEGEYYNSVYYVIPDQSGENAEGQAIESTGYFTIEKDPEVENGYLLKNFLAGFFRTGEESQVKLEFYDLKGTYDPETQTLTVPGGQPLMHVTETANGVTEEYDQRLVAGVQGQMWTYDDPITFRATDGRLFMTSFAAIIGNIVTENGETFLRGLPYLFFEMENFIPNGTLECYMSGLDSQKEFPILGVWKDGWFFVMNFTGCDPLHYAALNYDQNAGIVKGNNKWNPAGYAGWALTEIPADYTNGSAIEINFKLNPAFMDEQGYPTGTGYEIQGTVVKAENDEVIVEFPTYGLFDLNDILFAEIQDAVLTFKPNAIAGIEAVEVADNSNAPVVYYNLQGARVNNPANGIFIRQQGTQATKVLVK